MSNEYVTLDAYTGTMAQRLAAAMSDTGLTPGQTILVPRGETFDFSAFGGPVSAIHARTTVDFNGSTVIPRTSGVTFQGHAGGFRARNAFITSTTFQPDGAYVFSLEGLSPHLSNIYAEKQWSLVDLRSGNGAYIQAHVRNAAPGAASVVVGSQAYTGPVTLELFMDADTVYANQAFAGVLVRRCDVLHLRQSTILRQGINVLIQPVASLANADEIASGNIFAALIYLDECVIDSAVWGVFVQPISGNVSTPGGPKFVRAEVVRLQVNGGWYGVMSGGGFYLDNQHNGLLDSVTLANPEISTMPTGLQTIGPVTGLAIDDPTVTSCTFAGLYISAQTTGKITGGRFDGNSLNAEFHGPSMIWVDPDGTGPLGRTAVSGLLTLPNEQVDILVVDSTSAISTIQSAPAWANRRVSLRCARPITFNNGGNIQLANGVGSVSVATANSITFCSIDNVWAQV